MKRLFCLMCAVFVFCFLCAASSCGGQVNPHIPVADFTADITVNTGEMIFDGHFSNIRQGVMSLNLTSPETLDGIGYVLENDVYTYSLGELSKTGDRGELRKNSPVYVLFECMQIVAGDGCTYTNTDEDTAVFYGEEDSISCDVYSDKITGEIKKIESNGITFEFNNTQAIN